MFLLFLFFQTTSWQFKQHRASPHVWHSHLPVLGLFDTTNSHSIPAAASEPPRFSEVVICSLLSTTKSEKLQGFGFASRWELQVTQALLA